MMYSDSNAPAPDTVATTVRIEGMTCDSCAKLVTLRFKRLADVREVAVFLPEGRARIRGGRAYTAEELAGALEGTHYTASILPDDPDA